MENTQNTPEINTHSNSGQNGQASYEGILVTREKNNFHDTLTLAIMQKDLRQLELGFSAKIIELMKERNELKLANTDNELVTIKNISVPYQKKAMVFGQTDKGNCTVFFNILGYIYLRYNDGQFVNQAEDLHATQDYSPDLYSLIIAYNKARQSIEPELAASDMNLFEDGGFDAKKEFERIKQLPKAQRAEAIYDFRNKQETQTRLLSALPERVRTYIKINPQADPIEVYNGVLDKEAKHLSKTQQKEVLIRIQKYLFKRLATNFYFKKYIEKPKELLALITGLSMDVIEGKVTMELLEGSIVFDIENPEVFDQIHNKRYSERFMEATHQAVAYSNVYSNIDELKHAVIIGKQLAKYDHSGKKIILDHELRHQENTILLPNKEIKEKEKFLAFKPRIYLKEEILAYLKDGRFDSAQLKNILADRNGIYNYIEDRRKGLKELMNNTEDINIKNLWGEKLNQFNMKWTQELEDAYFKDLEKYIDIAFTIGVERIDELTITPVRKWHKLIEHTTEKQKTRKVQTLWQRVMNFFF